MIIDLSRNSVINEDSRSLDAAVRLVAEEGLSRIFKLIRLLQLNNKNVEWQAFNCSGKNTLSSDLIPKYLDVLACVHLVEENAKKKIKFIGGTPAQHRAIANYTQHNFGIFNTLQYFLFSFIRKPVTIAMCIFRAASMWYSFQMQPKKSKVVESDIALFTYIDGASRKEAEPYFGQLRNFLLSQNPDLKIIYIACVYAPYRARLREIPISDASLYLPLWSFLRPIDYIWVLMKILFLNTDSFLNGLKKNDIDFKKIAPLFEENIRQELSRGYLYHLLAYKAAQRIAESHLIKKFIYPFENKSIEKCILLGLKSNSPIRTIGYQHSSISKRHFNFVIDNMEFENTPWPDRVVTLGPTTKAWLSSQGGFPSEFLIAGCSLRHNNREQLFKGAFSAKSAKLLLVTSSSKQELIAGISFLQELLQSSSQLQLAVRPHHNFPMTVTPKEHQQWIYKHAIDCSGTGLPDNFSWADIILYVSSTVALESLQCGIPVIRLNLDILDSDPVIGNAPYWWDVNTPAECLDVIALISDLSSENKKVLIKNAQEFIYDYMKPPSFESLSVFMN
jgi:hypothetical protein